MEYRVGTQNSASGIGYRDPSLLFLIYKEVFVVQGAWHSSHMLPIVVRQIKTPTIGYNGLLHLGMQLCGYFTLTRVDLPNFVSLS